MPGVAHSDYVHVWERGVAICADAVLNLAGAHLPDQARRPTDREEAGVFLPEQRPGEPT